MTSAKVIRLQYHSINMLDEEEASLDMAKA